MIDIVPETITMIQYHDDTESRVLLSENPVIVVDSRRRLREPRGVGRWGRGVAPRSPGRTDAAFETQMPTTWLWLHTT